MPTIRIVAIGRLLSAMARLLELLQARIRRTLDLGSGQGKRKNRQRTQDQATVRISAIFDGTTCLSGHGHVEQQMRLWREKRGAGEDAASEGVAQCRGPSQGLERQFKPYKK